MIEVKKIESIEKIQNQRELYMKSLPFAQEEYIEQIVKKCDYYLIEVKSKTKGYFCVDKDKVLYEFYLNDEVLIFAQDIFKALLNKEYFISAESKTFDYLLMSLCLDFNKKALCSGYLFRNFVNVKNYLVGFDNICFRLANLKDSEKISDMSEDFFENLEEQILKEEIFVLYSNENLLAAGVVQKVFPSMNYYDIGMIVEKNHRGKGIGTYIITKLREICCEHNGVPICGCWYYNYASKRTLEKAGFISNHRIITFDFR
jgi:GNAT superfamily N-acetyltransferase